MPFSRREQERQRQREEERRREALERRQEEAQERQRAEARREEARRQSRELEAALEAAREKREALLARLRMQRRTERREDERRAERRATVRERLRDAVAERRRESEAAERREEALQEARREETRQEARQEQEEARRDANDATGRRAASRRSQLEEEQQDAKQATARAAARRTLSRSRADEEARAARRRADRQARRREATDDREPVEERRDTVHQARRGDDLRARRQDDLRALRRSERAAREPEARHDEQARHAARYEEARALKQESARREATVRTRREAQRAELAAAEQATARRATAREAHADQRRRQARTAARQARLRQAAAENGRPPRLPASHDRAAHANPGPASRDPLQERIPSGTLSGSLPWLRVEGSRIETVSGEPIVLRGVSLLGLDGAAPDPERGFAAGARIGDDTIDAVCAWGANVIRVAINRDRVLSERGRWSGLDYLAELDRLIERAAGKGAYTLLSLRRLDEVTTFGTVLEPDGRRKPNVVAPQPDYDSIGLWRIFGQRYADEPAVLFDLYSSPHRALPDDLTGYDTDWERWSLWVQLVVANLNRAHPRALCVVSGLDWATDLSGFPVRGTAGAPIPNLVYAAHLYRQRAAPPLWALARTLPLLITEWGGTETDIPWAVQTASALAALGIGWIAAHWNADPPLTRFARGATTATAFGAVVRRALASTLATPVSTRPRPTRSFVEAALTT